MIKAVVLDFDGVILESVAAKAKAFAELFEDVPEHVDAIVDFHIRNGGMNRFRKIRAIYEQILRQPLSSERLQELCFKFARLARKEVAKSPFVPGALEFIQNPYKEHMLCIVSATPQDELKEIVAERELTSYFRLVLGAPATKAENLSILLNELELKPKEAVFVGDAMTDFDGANQTGVPFIARVVDQGYNPFEGLSVRSVCDLASLPLMLSAS